MEWKKGSMNQGGRGEGEGRIEIEGMGAGFFSALLSAKSMHAVSVFIVIAGGDWS